MTQSARLIKKYPNRRLYDTETSSYVTVAEIKQLVIDHVEFQVVDAKTNQDLTRSVLMQIILEEESGLSPFFTADMLSQMIRSYGNAMQGFMGNYMEQGMKTFVEIQNKIQEQTKQINAQSAVPPINQDVWQQFVNAQGPALQGLMGNYLEQATSVFMDMQNQMQKQAKSFFGVNPFPFNTSGSFIDPSDNAATKESHESEEHSQDLNRPQSDHHE